MPLLPVSSFEASPTALRVGRMEASLTHLVVSAWCRDSIAMSGAIRMRGELRQARRKGMR
jgi:hypothetical protein